MKEWLEFFSILLLWFCSVLRAIMVKKIQCISSCVDEKLYSLYNKSHVIGFATASVDIEGRKCVVVREFAMCFRWEFPAWILPTILQ